MSSLPKAAIAILALPGVESLEREPDGWCCHLAYGWTTDALSGGGTIIDTNLKTIRAYVVGAYRIADTEPVAVLAAPAPMAPGPVLPGEVRPPAAPAHNGPLPELSPVTPWHRLTRGQAEAAWHAMLNRAVARHKTQAPMSHD